MLEKEEIAKLRGEAQEEESDSEEDNGDEEESEEVKGDDKDIGDDEDEGDDKKEGDNDDVDGKEVMEKEVQEEGRADQRLN